MGWSRQQGIGLAVGALLCAVQPGVSVAAEIAGPEPASYGQQLIDAAFGVAGVTDYRFRGVSNSSRKPAIQGYVELQALDLVYAGVWASSVDFPNPWVKNAASVEVDFYGGLRRSWGAPWGSLTFDVGALLYRYLGQRGSAPGAKVDYWELYAKPTVAFGDLAAVTVNAYWTSDYYNVGSDALYLSVIPKFSIPQTVFPKLGFYVSGEFGRQWIKNASQLPILWNWKDYSHWNVGGGVTWNAMTLDIRYSDTDLSKKDCGFNYGVRTWCGPTVIGKLSFDATLGAVK